MKQRAFKEQVFKLLFRAEFYNENTKEELLEQLPFYFESGDLTVSEEDRAKIQERLVGILDHLPEIDAPVGVIINDAVEIAKKFGQDGAGKFVNGVLASFVKDRES